MAAAVGRLSGVLRSVAAHQRGSCPVHVAAEHPSALPTQSVRSSQQLIGPKSSSRKVVEKRLADCQLQADNDQWEAVPDTAANVYAPTYQIGLYTEAVPDTAAKRWGHYPTR